MAARKQAGGPTPSSAMAADIDMEEAGAGWGDEAELVLDDGKEGAELKCQWSLYFTTA